MDVNAGAEQHDESRHPNASSSCSRLPLEPQHNLLSQNPHPQPSPPRVSTPKSQKESTKRNHSSIFHHYFRFELTTLSSGWVRKPNTLSGWFYFSKGETARRGRCLIRVLLPQPLSQRIFARTPLLNRWAYSIARKMQCFYGQGSSVYA
jgi:hypothetical protein